jgi:hypothetical protein
MVGRPKPESEQADASWENDPLFKVVRGHLTLAVAVLVGASTLLAVLLAARFSTTVAVALLSIAGPTSSSPGFCCRHSLTLCSLQ